MLLMRFLRAILGAGMGLTILLIYQYFYIQLPYQDNRTVFIRGVTNLITNSIIAGGIISGGIALARKCLRLKMGNLTRFLFGFFLLEMPVLYISLGWGINPLELKSLIAPLSVGGLAGLFYGNVSPKDQDWRLSKTLVALYRISSWVSGKREDDVTTLSLGKRDKPED